MKDFLKSGLIGFVFIMLVGAILQLGIYLESKWLLYPAVYTTYAMKLALPILGMVTFGSLLRHGFRIAKAKVCKHEKI